LLKLIAGEIEPSEGTVVRGSNTRLAYFDQARAQLRDDWSVIDNVADRKGAERDGGGYVQFGDLSLDLRSYLERFLFDGGKQRQPVGSLSGGERARVALAKALRAGANLLLLDEPTNDLDVAVLAELEELLLAWPGCVIAVSHDRSFLDRVASAILAFELDGKVVRYEGGYESYRAQRPEVASGPEPRTARSEAPRAKLPPPQGPKPLTQKERRELDGLFERIEQAEKRVGELAAELGDPRMRDGEDVRRRRAEYDAAVAAVAALTKRWEELEARSAS
jgi:ATP-binding cassette subfamily F protein uup